MSILLDNNLESLLDILNSYSFKVPSLAYEISIRRLNDARVRYSVTIEYTKGFTKYRKHTPIKYDLKNALIYAISMIERRIEYVGESSKGSIFKMN